MPEVKYLIIVLDNSSGLFIRVHHVPCHQLLKKKLRFVRMLKKKVEINKLQNKQIFCKQLCAGIQWCRLISHIIPLLIMSMFYLYSPENLRKSTF